jgi:hypothetical protein
VTAPVRIQSRITRFVEITAAEFESCACAVDRQQAETSQSVTSAATTAAADADRTMRKRCTFSA